MRTRAVRPRWTWLFVRSTARWSWGARATSASPEPGRGRGDCVHTPDRCTTLQRRHSHQPRLRREALGELVQIDGSEHRWFEDRADPCTLLVFIDDATGRLMRLRFVRSESAFAYFEALQGYLKDHGCPVAFYSDKHSVFRVARKEAKAGQ